MITVPRVHADGGPTRAAPVPRDEFSALVDVPSSGWASSHQAVLIGLVASRPRIDG
jgi:hypothetical protein